MNLHFKPSIYTDIHFANENNIKACLPWLRANELTWQIGSQRATISEQENLLEEIRLGVPTHRTSPMPKRERDALKKHNSFTPNDLERMWQEYRRFDSFIVALDAARLPVDAIAFYRAFHQEPAEEWGIYIYVAKLFEYLDNLYSPLQKHISFFSRESLLACILFEIFHHEFFHHLVEATATTIEFLSAAFGVPRPVYLSYIMLQRGGNWAEHPHHPLEEALANAYAYNSLSFVSFTRRSYQDGLVRLYQKLLPRYWNAEPAGYNCAAHYIQNSYITGAAQLLTMLLTSANPNFVSEDLLDANAMRLVGSHVLLHGHMAFEIKAQVPTYLVRTFEELDYFYKCIPAPNETYSRLFWHQDTEKVDAYFEQQYKLEQARKKAAQGN